MRPAHALQIWQQVRSPRWEEAVSAAWFALTCGLYVGVIVWLVGSRWIDRAPR